MKRLVLTLAATLAVAGPLASSGMASAKDHHGEGGWQQQRGGEERGGEGRGGGRWRDGPDRGDFRGPYPRGGEPRGDPRAFPRGGDPRGEPRAYPRDPRAYAPAPRDPRAYAPRDPEEQVIQDHARYRLRPPPRGFAWVRMGNGGFALIQESTGQVFDTIPGR